MNSCWGHARLLKLNIKKVPHTANIRVPNFCVVILLLPFLTWIFYQRVDAKCWMYFLCILFVRTILHQFVLFLRPLSPHKPDTLWKSCIEVDKSIVRCRFQTGSYHTNINKFFSNWSTLFWISKRKEIILPVSWV